MQTLARTIAEKISSANSDSAISTREQRKEAVKGLADKYASNPSGLLMYHPAGRPFMLGKDWESNFPPSFWKSTDRSPSISPPFPLQLLCFSISRPLY
jgi:hypothetical protein